MCKYTTFMPIFILAVLLIILNKVKNDKKLVHFQEKHYFCNDNFVSTKLTILIFNYYKDEKTYPFFFFISSCTKC